VLTRGESADEGLPAETEEVEGGEEVVETGGVWVCVGVEEAAMKGIERARDANELR
jgi:hypothetical protein